MFSITQVLTLFGWLFSITQVASTPCLTNAIIRVDFFVLFSPLAIRLIVVFILLASHNVILFFPLNPHTEGIKVLFCFISSSTVRGLLFIFWQSNNKAGFLLFIGLESSSLLVAVEALLISVIRAAEALILVSGSSGHSSFCRQQLLWLLSLLVTVEAPCCCQWQWRLFSLSLLVPANTHLVALVVVIDGGSGCSCCCHYWMTAEALLLIVTDISWIWLKIICQIWQSQVRHSTQDGFSGLFLDCSGLQDQEHKEPPKNFVHTILSMRDLGLEGAIKG